MKTNNAAGLLKADEVESLQAIKNREEHLTTRGAMLQHYNEVDRECIELARELAPLSLAGSPSAAALAREVTNKRMERDAIPYGWNRILDRKTHEIEKLTMPVILRFHELCLDRVGLLGKKRETQFIRGNNLEIDRRAVQFRHNFGAVGQAQGKMLESMKAVDAMHLSPLRAIRDRIAEFNREYEEIELSFETASLTESQFRHFQAAEIASENEPEQPTIYRREIGIKS